MFKTLKKLKVLIPFIKKGEKSDEAISKAIRKIDFEKFQDSIKYKIIDK